jgi:predicted dehydrogenase
MTYAEDPRTAPPLRWGIIGPGGIANTFAKAVNGHTESTVVAVGSRSKDRAEQFASRHGIPNAHEGYEALVADPLVQAVYVASPHSEHRDHALLAIAAGKHVLVEKAFTRNATEAQEVVDAARSAGVFAMEAMWTRFLPHMMTLRALIERGEIGEVVTVLADHGQSFGRAPVTHRLHNPDLAGGALLDLGVYPISFAHDMLGVPDTIHATGSLTPAGVDGQVTMAFGYGERAQASLHTTLWSRTPTTACVGGTDGRVEVDGNFYAPNSFTVTRDDKTWWSYDRPVEGGFQYEAAEVARCVAEGRGESPLLTLDNTLEVMRSMDEVRRQIGVVYPGE